MFILFISRHKLNGQNRIWFDTHYVHEYCPFPASWMFFIYYGFWQLQRYVKLAACFHFVCSNFIWYKFHLKIELNLRYAGCEVISRVVEFSYIPCLCSFDPCYFVYYVFFEFHLTILLHIEFPLGQIPFSSVTRWYSKNLAENFAPLSKLAVAYFTGVCPLKFHNEHWHSVYQQLLSWRSHQLQKQVIEAKICR